MAIRTEMGRLPLPRLQAGRCGRFAREVGKTARPLFPGGRRVSPGPRSEQFVVDGELVIEIDGALSFDALQMRLHPADSRIRKLAVATPARLMLFDMLLAPDGTSCASR